MLDLSKLRMYRLQYIELERYRNQFAGCRIDIVAGDTDSFFLEVIGVDLAKLLLTMRGDGLLDTSNYPAESPLFSRAFENKVGLFKDESGGVEKYLEWIFLRPKCYSMLSEHGSTHKAKGVTRQTKIDHDRYVEIFKSFRPDAEGPTSPKRLCVNQHRFGSVIHQLYTLKYNKVALSIKDDKRKWIAQNTSLPYGHHRLPQ